MKKFFAGFAAAALCLAPLSGCSNGNSMSGGLEIDSRVDVPDFTLKTVDGQTITLSEYRGQRSVLVVFWATWCPYCREEMPNLVELKEKHGDKIEILAISIQESREVVASYIAKQKVNFPVLLDEDGNVSAQYGVAGVPTLVLVDLEGKGVVAENALNGRMLAALAKAFGA